MKYRFLLWLNVLVFCAYLTGHLFDLLIIVPNWNTGLQEEIRLYNEFFQQADPRHFFTVIRPFSIFISFLCLVAFWSKPTPLRVLLIISFLIDVLIYLVTLALFQPINDYLFLNEAATMQPALVKSYVSKWVAANYIRIALVIVGLYASVLALHFSYRFRR